MEKKLSVAMFGQKRLSREGGVEIVVKELCTRMAKAGQLGLAGWVRNRYDGSVEMEVEGAETDIDQMILFLQNRTYIWIEDMRVKSMSLEGEYGFYERDDI